MHAHHFALVLDRPPDLRQAIAVMRSHRDIDVSPGVREATVNRRTHDFTGAVVSAIHDLEQAGLVPVRIHDNDWVTLADVGERVGRSRELVRRWSTGRYGPNGFPPPINPGAKTLFYSWVEVAAWLRGHTGIAVAGDEPDLVVANLLLRARRLAPRSRDAHALPAILTPVVNASART